MQKMTVLMTMVLISGLMTIPGVCAGAPKGLSDAQWQSMREAVAARVYRIGPGQAPGTFRADNPAHGISATFDRGGFSAVIQREGTSVTFSLRPVSYGYEKSPATVDRVAALDARGSRIDMAWDKTLTEWHENGPSGLRQNFTLSARPAGAGGPLVLTLMSGGDLVPEARDGAIVFTGASHRGLLTYSGLKAWDATGRILPAAMTVAGKTPGAVVVRVDDSQARYPVTIDPLLARFESKMTAGDGAAGDYFGFNVAVSGDIAVVGAYYDDDNNTNSGSAYVFERGTDGAWSQTAKLTADDGAAGDYFGYSVAVSGDTALVGANQDDDNDTNTGSAYVFERGTDGTWGQTAKLTASDGVMFDCFGISVAVSGDIAVVGTVNNAANGSAYVFERGTDGAWSQTSKLTADDGAAGDKFGISVAVSGDIAVVGAFGDDDNGTDSGSAYVFERGTAGAWAQTAKLTAGDGGIDDFFGYSIAISGDTVIVGAYGDDDNGSESGSAYIFERGTEGTWSQTLKLTADDGAENDEFGLSVAVSGDDAVVGAFGDDDNGTDSGSAYVFERGTDGAWNQTAKLTADDGAEDDEFGLSVAVSGDTALVGAYRDDDNGSNTGSAYMYDLLSIIEQPQAAAVGAAGDISSAEYPFDIQTALDTSHLLVHGNLTGFRDGTTSIDAATGIWQPATSFYPGETATVWLLPGITLAGNIVQDSSLIWQFTATAQASGGTFMQAASFGTGGYICNTGALGDVDRDGDLDAVLATEAGGALWLNDGNGRFSDAGRQLGNDAGNNAMALGDLDRDGDLDAVFADAAGISVWLNDGSGVFTDSGQSLGTTTLGLALGDVDGDGDLDLVAAASGADTVWLNDGAAGFTDSGQSLAIGDSYHAMLGDVDVDGDLDLVVAGAGADTVWLNDGDGIFTDSGQSLGAGVSYQAALGDLDGDGYPDLATAGPDGVSVRENDGTGAFGDARVLAGNAKGMGLGDLDGDGDLDILGADFGAYTLWLNDGDGLFADSGQSLGDTYAAAALPGDLDGDGDLDILAVGLVDDHTVWLNRDLPAIATGAVAQIESGSATAAGTITFLGGYAVTAHGFVWNTDGAPTIDDSMLALGAAAAAGAFTGEITGLSAETTYHLRAFAGNDAGTAYGDEVEFTTPAAPSDDNDDGEDTGDGDDTGDTGDTNTTYSGGGGGGGCFINCLEMPLP